MAGKAAVYGFSKNREPRGNANNSDLVASFLDDEIRAAWFRRRKEHAVRSARNVFASAEDADVRFYFVVVGREIVISDWPIIAQAVPRRGFKIDRGKTQCDAAPVIRAAAHNPRTEPLKVCARRGGIWF